MTNPKRIKVRRTRGWRMPANARYVGRPTKWGNPWKIGALTRAEAVEKYEHELKSGALKDRGGLPLSEQLHELRGLDLACWCPLGEPCHADVLLRLANHVLEDS